ncbi:MAG: YHS domain-containing (seleno)protein [Paracoccaceae bacterium]
MWAATTRPADRFGNSFRDAATIYSTNGYLQIPIRGSSLQAESGEEVAMSGITRSIGSGLAAAMLLLGGLAHADNPPVSIDEAGYAIDGYDTVAYFTDSQPQPGDPAYSHVWKGATWLFASAAHRDAFAADPERYAPQFGGYCAFAISKGHAVKARPEIWSIVDDKLYLNLGPGAQKKWKADVPGNIARAVSNWPDALIDPGSRKAVPEESGER